MADIYVANERAIATRLAEEVESLAARAISGRGLFSVALPGGSVATSCFPALAALPLPWQDVHFFWADERAVPPSDTESNYGLADRLWLTPAHVPPSSVHRMPADAPDISAAASQYSSELTRVLGAQATLDFVLLGMGPDGHIASLFPGHPLLDERERLVAEVIDSPKPPPRRLTLTMPVLTGAHRVVVVAFGSSKAQALTQTLDAQSLLPVSQVLRKANSALVLADESAAAMLKARNRNS